MAGSPAASSFLGGIRQRSRIVGGVNGDGIPDLFLPADASLNIPYGKGDSNFEPTTTWGVDSSPGQILLENLHGQPATANLADVVSPDRGGGVTVLINITKSSTP